MMSDIAQQLLQVQKRIADAASLAGRAAAEIQLLLSRIYQSEKSQSKTRTVNLYKEQYQLFVFAALIFLLLESLILPLKRQGGKK